MCIVTIQTVFHAGCVIKYKSSNHANCNPNAHSIAKWFCLRHQSVFSFLYTSESNKSKHNVDTFGTGGK